MAVSWARMAASAARRSDSMRAGLFRASPTVLPRDCAPSSADLARDIRAGMGREETLFFMATPMDVQWNDDSLRECLDGGFTRINSLFVLIRPEGQPARTLVNSGTAFASSNGCAGKNLRKFSHKSID